MLLNTGMHCLRQVPEKWIRQNWLPSVSSCRPTGVASRHPPKLQLVIPTETEVRNSVEGWAAGMAIPIQRKKHQAYDHHHDEPIYGATFTLLIARWLVISGICVSGSSLLRSQTKGLL